MASERSGAPATALLNPTIVPGGGVVECDDFTLAFTIGEAVAGSVSGGGWALTSGFLPTLPDPGLNTDVIFANGFESVTTQAVARGACAP